MITKFKRNCNDNEYYCKLTDYLDDQISYNKSMALEYVGKSYLYAYDKDKGYYDIRYPGATRGYIRLDIKTNKITEINMYNGAIYDLLNIDTFKRLFIDEELIFEDMIGDDIL